VAEGDGEGLAATAHMTTPDVFISYASQDTAVANALVAALESQEITCWIAPRDVTPGTHYASEIVHAIDSAKAIVLILSKDAATSPHVLREIERATSKRHPVVTLRVDQASLPAEFEYFLNTSQWLDASGGDATRMMPKLVAAVKSAIKAPVATSAAGAASRAPSHGGVDRSRYRVGIALGTLLVVAIAGFAAYRSWHPARQAAPGATPIRPTSIPAAPAMPEKSVAVLPFVDMSEKRDQEYFSDGLSEELIDHLAQTQDLKVIARTSSFQFKGKNEDMRAIGQKLGVANLLEGSVRTSGKTLRVTAQLIKVADGSHLWSKTYDRAMGDIFKVQDEIATAVVAALQATITKPKVPSNEKPVNIEAYNAILRARYLFRKLTKEDTERGIAVLDQATRLDPTNAAAWAELARGYNSLLIQGAMAPQEAYLAGRNAVGRALALNPNLAAAHYYLAFLELNFNHDYLAAEAEIRQAHALEPNPVWDADFAGAAAANAGRFDEAIRAFQKETEYDPLSPWALNQLGTTLLWANRLPEAERVMNSLLELEPNFASAHCYLGQVLLAKNKPEEAFGVMREEPAEGWRLTCLPRALWMLGRRAEADAMLVEAKSKYENSLAYQLAETYAIRDDKNEAFKWLARAYDNREGAVQAMNWDPFLNNLHGDPRFIALLRKVTLPE
jgi:TolB-like protein/cytochrome c-type biogenesis protein CcmH/NrfG